ncbi:hypothetical protein GCM10009554_06890 [Kribbella koreensis]|uniref:Resolvase/invertase-type recombinase catalytic domain-containing protein n=2 Tax=Kribbella TaxID=182639 RepID=A0ABP6XIJ6_9ACTN
MDAAEPQRDRRNSREKQHQDGAECSDHDVQPAIVLILSQLRKYETVLTLGLPSTRGPPERSQ